MANATDSRYPFLEDSDHQIDSRFILAVYEKVMTHGKKVTLNDAPNLDARQLEGLTAYSDFDGYNAYLEDAEVKIQTGFHNTFKVDYESGRAHANFLKKMRSILATYD